MTEVEWLDCADPDPMLSTFGEKWQSVAQLGKGFPTDRKLQLFTVECCRRLWSLIPDERYRRVVEVAAGFTEGTATAEQLNRAAQGIHGNVGRLNVKAYYAVEFLSVFVCGNPRTSIARHVSLTAASAVADHNNERRAQCEILRDLFGPLPFRPIAFDPRWRTADVLGLTRGIYEERAFDRLPMLADALMDAGCDSEDILSHCRGDGPHVRGCWVVDLVLGKE